VAGLLEHAAQRRLRRGDAAGAVTALLAPPTSARVVPTGAGGWPKRRTSGRDVTGQLRTVQQLLIDARRADLGGRGNLAR
jgi:hypothetical protein